VPPTSSRPTRGRLFRAARFIELGLLTTIVVVVVAVLCTKPMFFTDRGEGLLLLGSPRDQERCGIAYFRQKSFATEQFSTWVALTNPYSRVHAFTDNPSDLQIPGRFERILLPWVDGSTPPPRPETALRSNPIPLDVAPIGNVAAFGWPYRCFWYARDFGASQADKWPLHLPITDIPPELPSGGMWRPRIVTIYGLFPGSVMPIGLAANTCFFAGLWFLASRRLKAWTAARRAIQNKCSRCGYSRAGLPETSACPECAKVLRHTTSVVVS